MKTIQMTIDESLLSEVDAATQTLGTTRSEFVREALRLALQRLKISNLERQHRAGYRRQPIAPGEFDVWESEQAWGEP
jgi:metal-responsive CopG/Arc/MetJ family transcriptional regulator